MTDALSEQLTAKDFNDLWYLVDYYGIKMWPADRVEVLRLLIKAAEKSAAQ